MVLKCLKIPVGNAVRAFVQRFNARFSVPFCARFRAHFNARSCERGCWAMQGKDERGREAAGKGPHGGPAVAEGAGSRQRRSRSIPPRWYPAFGRSNASPGSSLTKSEGAVSQTLGFLRTALLKKNRLGRRRATRKLGALGEGG